MLRRWILLVAVLVAFLALCAIPVSLHADGAEAVVPENCWPMAGGGPARTGYTRTRPLTGPLRVDWKRSFRGPLVGEPLVWDDTIVVCVGGSGQGYSLHLLSLQTGKSLGSSTKLKASEPPLPSLWRRRLAVRDDNGVTLYRVGRMRLSRAWQQEVIGCVDLQLVGEEVIFASTSHVSGRRSTGGDALYVSSEAPRSLMVRGKYGLQFLVYDREGNGHWTSGSLSSDRRVFVGHHEGIVPDVLARPVLANDELFVRMGRAMALRGGGTANTVWLRRSSDAVSWEMRTLCQLWATPVSSPTQCIIPLEGDKSGPRLMRYEAPMGKDPSGLILANRDAHPELLASKHMTLARDVLYLGANRINLKTLELYEPLPVPVFGRVVPAKESLLVLSGEKELSCLREVDPRREERVAIRAAAQAGQHMGRLVDLDGKTKKAKLSWTEKEINNGRKMLSVDKYLLVRSNDGTIVHAGSTHAALEGLRILIQEAEGEGYAGLATDAVKALDVTLTGKYIRAAEDRGATNDITKWTRRRLAELSAEQPAKKVKEKGVEAARKKELELLADTTNWIWASYEKLNADAPWHVRAELLRAVLARDPQHKEAVAAVKAAIPEGVPLPKTFDAQRWLMLADAVQIDPVRIAPPDGPDAPYLEFARRTWRRDVIGLRSSNLLIVTPEADPAQVATCLATGEAVCRELEKMFGKPSEGGAPLVLHLFQTKEAYLRVTTGGHTFTEDNIAEASAGHYSPRLNLSRIFLPSGEDAFAALTETYQHELTHHWLQARCPLPRTQGRRDHGPSTPGFFLVEGVAELVSEFKFDLRRAEVQTRDPRVSSLDVVAHAPKQLRLEWPWLITANQFQFSKLRTDKPVPVPMRWRVGLRRQMTQMTMFYAQAGAVAQYLYHTSADTRAQLVDLVLRYYEGTLTPKHLEEIAGLRPNALGVAVRKFGD